MSSLTELIVASLMAFREHSSDLVYAAFPSPNAELILGLVLGANDVKELGKFNEIMRGVGLIHVVVVSGYNINLVFGLALKAVGSKFKFINLFIAQILVTCYAIMTGFQIPTLRALLMSSSLYWTRYFGYKVSPYRLLITSAIVIIIYDREMLSSLSFQLSFAATLGLIVLGNVITRFSERLPLPANFTADLSATFSAQLFVLPIIYRAFRSLNLVGFVSNPVILWLVPLMTLSAFAFIGISLISPVLGAAAKIPLMFLSELFIGISKFLFGVFSA